MPKETKMVLAESPEAAQKVSIMGWLSRTGRFYPGDDETNERVARWDGATHKRCECGEIFEAKHYSVCETCRFNAKQEAHAKAPRVVWDQTTPIYLECFYPSQDRYFFSDSELFDYCETNEITPEHMMLYLCEPNYTRELDPSYFEDDLPDNDDYVPRELIEAINAFNKAMKDWGQPLSWGPGKTAVIVTMPPSGDE